MRQGTQIKDIAIQLTAIISILWVFGSGCSGPDTPGNPVKHRVSASVSVETPPKHLIFITIDTLRPDFLGCYGNPWIHTPNIDRLARYGNLFRKCTVPLGRTNPSIASMLTSRYPHDHSVRALWDKLPSREETLPEVLKANGFTSIFINGNALLSPRSGLTQGIDEYFGPRSGMVRFFEPDKTPSKKARHARYGWKADRITTKAIAMIEHLKTGGRFNLWTHYMDPHWSYNPPAPWKHLYTQPIKPERIRAATGLPPGTLRYQNALDRDVRKEFRKLYAGEIVYTDNQLGRLIRRLTRENVLNNAVLVLTSDHGEALGENGFYYCHGDEVYRQSIRVPLILGRMTGDDTHSGIRTRPVTSLEIAGRVLDRLGLHSEAHTPDPQDITFAETGAWSMKQNRRKHFDGIRGKWRMAMDHRYKYIRIPHPGEDIHELYDLKRDPGETVNLTGRKPAVEQRLNAALNAWMADDASADVEIREPTPESPDLQEKLKTLGYIQ